MKGYLYINSYELQMDGYSKEAKTKFNIEIKYDDGQYLKTDLTIPYIDFNFQNVYKAACKYFKGDLTLMR